MCKKIRHHELFFFPCASLKIQAKRACYTSYIFIVLFHISSCIRAQKWPFWYSILSQTIAARKCLLCKGGLSTNNLGKSQISNFADLQNLLNLRTFRLCGNGRICNFQSNCFFAICDVRICDMETQFLRTLLFANIGIKRYSSNFCKIKKT